MSSSSGGISRYVGKAWATVVVAAAVTAGAVGVPAVTGGGGEEELTANIWLVPASAAGSTSCSRTATPVTLADAQTAQKCKDGANTLDDACEAAADGDVIRVQAGTAGSPTEYAAQAVTCTNTFDVTVQGEDPVGVEDWDDIIPTATTIFNGLDYTNTSRLHLSGVTIADTDSGCAPTNKLVDIINADDSSLENVNATRIKADGSYLECDLGSFPGGNEDFEWRESHICCNMNQKLMQLDDVVGQGDNGRVAFIDVRLGEQVWGVGDSDVHAEGWWCQDTGEFELTNVITLNTISSGALNWGGSGGCNPNWTNTVWGPTYAYGETDVLPGAAVGYRGAARSILIEGANIGATGTIDYSILHGDIVLTSLGAVTWRGNITSQDGCGSGQTWAYNRHTGADCSASDVQDASALDSGRFADSANGNYRPASTGVAQVGAGDPGSHPSADVDGVTRPQGTNPDQGAYEIVGGG